MLFCFASCEPLRQRYKRCDPAPIIIRSGRAKHRVIVRADHDDLRVIPWNFRFNIMALLPAHFVAISSGAQSGARKRILDKIGGGVELWVMPHVALADFS